ncbi:16S rRNA (cytosine(1407)-C(5))-methyltransferase RsmF [Vibrio caribbeanicus]|uniref:16S rRNA (cytosine(1407)-C(5))-methyltransferase RsmF n=1 Tax=Vibrio caribbeanicus TaxID=701175 RepID=UPI00228345F6|nr:16S rRNA (cytosine(1407)-C(5))-methyltransferase RsmF [Vibrio caribbeanicus]MCY9843265.1 16S rRNA (cytosine(1407)-C(5))-methyltransferase RsmF [Vibrio caribbeanicus]
MHQNVYLPAEFLSKIESILPKHLKMDDFISACQRPLRKSIRVNTLKSSISDFMTLAKAKGWHIEQIPWCKEGFWVDLDEEQTPLGSTAEHLSGLFYIQEASSMIPVSALFSDSTKLQSVLDMAAAPGSKTTQIAALMGNKGVLIANEYSASRVKALHANIERCGIRNTALSNFDGEVFGSWLPEAFDAVLIDAPCSGEGTVRKDDSALKNWSLKSIQSIADTQKKLIESAFHALKPGGTLVYSTCTLSLEENQFVCRHLKDKFADSVEFESLNHLFPGASESVTDEGFLHVFPQMYDSEGFFVAKLKKIASIEKPDSPKTKLGKFPFIKANHKQHTEITHSLKDSLGVTLPDDSTLWLRDRDVWLFPQSLEPFLAKFRFSRMGVKIAESHKSGYRWQHQVATALVTGNEGKIIDISVHEAREWVMGRDIRPEGILGKGEVIIRYNNGILGLGKWVGSRIKNGLPRELVKDKHVF